MERLPQDPRVEKLAELMGIAYPYALGVRATLRFIAEDRYPIGDLSGMSAVDLAKGMEYTGNPEAMAESLVASGFMERRDGGFFVPDWVDEEPKWFGFSKWIRATNQEEI